MQKIYIQELYLLVLTTQINKQFFFGVIYYFLVENDEEQWSITT